LTEIGALAAPVRGGQPANRRQLRAAFHAAAARLNALRAVRQRLPARRFEAAQLPCRPSGCPLARSSATATAHAQSNPHAGDGAFFHELDDDAVSFCF